MKKLRKTASQSLKPAPGDDDLKKLLKDRYNTALQGLQAGIEECEQGRHHVSAMLPHVLKVRDSWVELNPNPADQIAIRELYFEVAKAGHEMVEGQFRSGTIGAADVAAARYTRIDAEIQLLLAKRKAKAQPRSP